MPKRNLDFNTRSMGLRTETLDEKARSVEAVFSTEAPAEVLDYRSWTIINEVLLADGCEHGDQVVMLANHSRWSLDDILGCGREIKVTDDNKVVGRLFFTEGDEIAEKAWNKVKQGHLTDVSVGYRPLEYTDIEPGKTATIAGRKFEGGAAGVRITTKWKLREISPTPIGADENAKIREAQHFAPAAEANKEVHCTMNDKLRAVLAALGLRADADEAQAWGFYRALDGDPKRQADDVMGDSKAPELTPAPEPTRSAPASIPAPAPSPATAPAPGLTQADVDSSVAAERQRGADIRTLGERHNIDVGVINAAIAKGASMDQARADFLEASLTARTNQIPSGVSIAVVPNATRDALAYGLMNRCNLEVVDPNASDATRKKQEELAERGSRYRDLSLIDLCRAANNISGAKDPMTGSIPTLRDETIRAAVSGSTLANIFTTSVNARLMQAYGEAPNTVGSLVRRVDVSDFKTNERIGLGKGGALPKLARGDTAKHAKFSDIAEEYRISRYAQQFFVDEQDIIDDNLGAIMEAPAEIGRAAARLEPDLVYAILLANANLSDGTALFATGHSNLTTAALAEIALQAALTAMFEQTYDDVQLNLAARTLFVCPALEWTARKLLRSGDLITRGDTDATFPSRNVIADLNLDLVIEGRLNATGVTDPNTGTAHAGSATNWFLAASSASARTIEVGYLTGSGRRPQLRRSILDKGQWGIGWDIKHDIGAKALDYRGLHKSTGAG